MELQFSFKFCINVHVLLSGTSDVQLCKILNIKKKGVANKDVKYTRAMPCIYFHYKLYLVLNYIYASNYIIYKYTYNNLYYF